ncbi:MBOAT family O-acyltransferase [Neptunomonas marina]|uniref:Probable alginate O-acetylase n=1 Tax=Neptunomonas marina TaxID=1815562 RepID=A0A437Q8R7_9GAMM|nr:MBOAT family O-acyltransferase [Neptunomonas marina]RVU30972.1 MBOAT family protein [Neptunomonas marina]
MAFQSFHYVVFFLVIFGLVRGVFRDNHDAKKNCLLAASYYFYMCWDWRFAGLIFGITLINYIIGQKIADATDQPKKKAWLTLSLVSSLGILAYFKYTNFFIDSFNTLLTNLGVETSLPLLSIILPVGISFYTFQSISYSLDIYRGRLKPVSSLRDFSLFVAFFPQLVAGPIVRASHFLPQLEEGYKEEQKNPVESGVALIIRGFIKKIAIADVLAVHIVDPAFASPGDYSPWFLLIALYAYSYQVYMDFSGYTDIARGTARCLGFELQINFDRPYKATSIGDFWRRWHISMSSFFRDYLFYGLGGSKYGNVYVNLFITFVAIGVWHGAGWNFVVYGICHASMIAYERWRMNRRKAAGLPPLEYTGLHWIWRVFWIFTLVSLTRVLFRGGSLDDAWLYVEAMTNFTNTHTPIGLVGGATLLIATALHYTPSKWTFEWKNIYCRMPSWLQAGVIVTTTYLVVAFSTGTAPFIYFQF